MVQTHKKYIGFISICISILLIVFLWKTSVVDAQKQDDGNSAVYNQDLAGVDSELGYNPVEVLVRLAPRPARRAQSRETVRSLNRTVFRDRSIEKPEQIFRSVYTKDTEHELARWFTFQFQTPEEAELFVKKSAFNPWIEVVDRDVVHYTQVVPQDEFFQTGSVQSLWGHEMINVQELWDGIENPGEGVIVAVVDTGVSNAGNANNPWTHSDLLGSEWVGADGTVLGSSPASIAPVWEDYNGHGTHVAGTIGARTNEFGIPGIAFDATIMAYKLSNGGSWTSSTGVAGIVYAVDNGASVINASFGSARNAMTDDAVKYAFDNDVLFVAAAGNDSGLNVCEKSPAGSEYAVAVGSVDRNRNVSSFSNVGTGIDVTAPGGGFTGSGSQHRILSTATKSPNGIGSPIVTDSQGDPYTAINGTSMATPHVAAAAVIIRQVRPEWNVEEVWAGIRFIANQEPGSDFNDGFGHGVIDLGKIANLPEIIPVAQMYEPENCFSPSEGGAIEIRGSAYVSGGQEPSQIRIEIAEGYDVTDDDFELLTVVNQEVQDSLLYTWDATQYPLGTYTLRVVTDFGDYSTEDRNQIAFIQYDYKTVLRMSLTRILGFDSIMPSSPETSQGYVFTPKSYFNRFLYEYNQDTDQFTPLVQYPTGEFNGVIDFPNPSPSFTSDNVWYKGFIDSDITRYEMEPIPVVSPSQFTQRSLAAFDNSRTDEVYLTYPFLDIGEQKVIHPNEREVLCHLGFAVEGASDICDQNAPIPVTDYKTFSASDPFVCVVPGLNDLFRGIAPAANNQSQFPGVGAHVLKRLIFDTTDQGLDGVVLGPIQCPINLANSFGGGVIQTLTRRTVSFFFNNTIQSSRQARYNVVARDSQYTANLTERRLSQDGRIVLWFCENPYNYICNGNFEKGRSSQSIADSYQGGVSGGNHLLQRLVADNWASIGTADLYLADVAVQEYPHIGIPSNWWGQDENIFVPMNIDPFNSRFVGFANTTNVSAGSDHREVIFTQLGRSFNVGQEYQIRFNAWSSSVKPNNDTYNADPSIGDHMLYVLGSTTQFNSSSQILNQDGSVNLSVFDEVFVEINLDEEDAYDNWVTVSQNFTPTTSDISFIYIISHAQLNDVDAMVASGKDSYSRYVNLDDFIVEPQLPYRDLRVEKNMISDTQTGVNQNVSFEVVVTNDSEQMVDNVQVQDYLPDGFIVSNAVASQGQDYQYLNLEHMIVWEDITLQSNESITFTVSGIFTTCQGEFRNVAIAYSLSYLDITPENNFVDVYRQGFPFNTEIDSYSGAVGGEMGCVGTISGRVFSDLNQNGFQDIGESGLPSYMIGLYRQDDNQNFILEQTVSSSIQNLGVYAFSPQQQGVYAIQLIDAGQEYVTVPLSTETTIEDSNYNYILSMNNNVSYVDRNFGLFQGRVVNGVVYEDLDMNGSYQFGEPLLSGVDVGLFWDEGEGYYTFIESMFTDSVGEYEFIIPSVHENHNLLLKVYVPGNTNIVVLSEPTFTPELNHPNPQFALNTYSITNQQPTENPYFFGVVYEEIEPSLSGTIDVSGFVFYDVDDDGLYTTEEDDSISQYRVNLYRETMEDVYELVSYVESDQFGAYVLSDTVPYGQYYITLDSSHVNDVSLSVPAANTLMVENSPYHYSILVDSALENSSIANLNFGFVFNVCHPFDINGDGIVNSSDLGQFMSGFSTFTNNSTEHLDFNSDGQINYLDGLMMVSMLGCPNTPRYSVGGFVFNDINQNGVYDEEISGTSTNGVVGTSLYLYKQNQNGIYELIDETMSRPGIGNWSQNIFGVPSFSFIQLSGAYLFRFNEPGEYAIALGSEWERDYLVTYPESNQTSLGDSSRIHFVTVNPSSSQYMSIVGNDFGLNFCGCPGNFTGNQCAVNSEDVMFFQQNLYQQECPSGQDFCPGDFTGDNQVSASDLFLMLSYMGCSSENMPLQSVYMNSIYPLDVLFSGSGISVVENSFTYNSESEFYERTITLNNTNGETFPGFGLTMNFQTPLVVFNHVTPLGLDIDFVDVLTTFSGDIIFQNNVDTQNIFTVSSLPANQEITFIFRFSPN